jgi:hypothetical protein
VKVLHILKRGPDDTTKKIIEGHKKDNEVMVVELYKKEKVYEEIIDLIEKTDRIITW